MNIDKEFLPDTGKQLPRIYFDQQRDETYPQGVWACTVDDSEGGYDTFYGATPNEAYLAWKEATA